MPMVHPKCHTKLSEDRLNFHHAAAGVRASSREPAIDRPNPFLLRRPETWA